MASIEISGAKNLNRDRETFYNINLEIKIIGDIIPANKDKLMTDFEGFLASLRQIPSLLEKLK